MERRRFPAQKTPRRLCHRRWHYFNSAWYQYSRKRWTSARCSTLGPSSPPVAGEERSPPTSRGATAPPYRRSRRSGRVALTLHPAGPKRPRAGHDSIQHRPVYPAGVAANLVADPAGSVGDRRPRPGRRSRLPLVRELSSSVPSHLSGTIHPHLRQTPSGRLWPHLFEPIRLLELPEFHSL